MESIHSLRQSLSYTHRLRLIAVLVLSSVAALGLQVIRQDYTAGQGRFWHIAWDVFLAWVPLAFAAGLYHAHERGTRNRTYLLVLGVLWLLFFPNAPYLLTEFIHLPGHPGGPAATHIRDAVWWIDLVVTLDIAWVGLLLGFVSLYLVQRVVEARSNLVVGWLMVLVCLSIGAFGVTLGRFERLNSWDAFSDPQSLAGSLKQFADPWTIHHNIGLSALLAAFLVLAYLALVALMAMGREESLLVGRQGESPGDEFSVFSLQFSAKKKPSLGSSLKGE